MQPGLNDLIEISNFFKNQTPSSPAWFQSVDQVVGVLLAIEIERVEEAMRSGDRRSRSTRKNSPEPT